MTAILGMTGVLGISGHEERRMSKVTYHIVEHDGGWAYRVDGVFSEPFPTHEEARLAA